MDDPPATTSSTASRTAPSPPAALSAISSNAPFFSSISSTAALLETTGPVKSSTHPAALCTASIGDSTTGPSPTSPVSKHGSKALWTIHQRQPQPLQRPHVQPQLFRRFYQQFLLLLDKNFERFQLLRHRRFRFAVVGPQFARAPGSRRSSIGTILPRAMLRTHPSVARVE